MLRKRVAVYLRKMMGGVKKRPNPESSDSDSSDSGQNKKQRLGEERDSDDSELLSVGMSVMIESSVAHPRLDFNTSQRLGRIGGYTTDPVPDERETYELTHVQLEYDDKYSVKFGDIDREFQVTPNRYGETTEWVTGAETADHVRFTVVP